MSECGETLSADSGSVRVLATRSTVQALAERLFAAIFE
jgi:hypothetical protein